MMQGTARPSALEPARDRRAAMPAWLYSLLLLALLGSLPAWGWGGMGHRLVAQHAEMRLQPATRAAVNELLAADGATSLADIAMWADELRDDPELKKRTGPLHYINFPRGRCQYDAARLCPQGQCVVAAIERYSAILADHSRPLAERSEALRFVVHFIADVHQPLHAGWFEDRGGNRFQISYQREGWNLHSVWDSLLLKSGERSADDYLAELRALSLQDRSTTGAGSAASWAEESCRLVHSEGFYPPRHLISRSYLEQMRPIALLRLAEAGERLAAMLEQALGAES